MAAVPTKAQINAGDSVYGEDIGGTLTDIDLKLSFAVGTDVLAADLVARLTDKLWYDPTYGFPLVQLLNSMVGGIPRLEKQVETELSKDDRVDQIRCTIAPTDVDGVYSIEIFVVPVSFNQINTISGARVSRRRLNQNFELVANISTLGITDLKAIPA